MFYTIIKNFFLKKNVIKRLATQNSIASNDKVLTIGVLVDETYFAETSQLVERIISQGIQKNNISILVYKDKIKKKEEINEALKKVDPELGQTLFVSDSSIRPDGGIIEVKEDNGNWRIVLVSEAKRQGKDIENIKNGKLVGKNNNQDLMAAGNAI